MQIKTPVFTICMLVSTITTAQFAQFWNNRTLYNPAFQNLEFKHTGNITHRAFPSLEGVSTSSLTYSTHIDKIYGALGLNYYNFHLLNANSNILNLAYNYQKSIGTNTLLSAGFAIGQAFAKTPPFFAGNVNTERDNSTSLDVGLAAKWKKGQIGVAFKNVLPVDPLNAMFVPVQSINAMAQYTFGKETSFQFSPQAYFGYYDGFYERMYNLSVAYRNRYFIGIGGRSTNGIMASLGLVIYQKFRLSYTYERFNSKLNKGNGNHYHEFGIGIQLNKR